MNRREASPLGERSVNTTGAAKAPRHADYPNTSAADSGSTSDSDLDWALPEAEPNFLTAEMCALIEENERLRCDKLQWVKRSDQAARHDRELAELQACVDRANSDAAAAVNYRTRYHELRAALDALEGQKKAMEEELARRRRDIERDTSGRGGGRAAAAGGQAQRVEQEVRAVCEAEAPVQRALEAAWRDARGGALRPADRRAAVEKLRAQLAAAAATDKESASAATDAAARRLQETLRACEEVTVYSLEVHASLSK